MFQIICRECHKSKVKLLRTHLYHTNFCLQSWKECDKPDEFENTVNMKLNEGFSGNCNLDNLARHYPHYAEKLKAIEFKLYLWRQSGIPIPEKFTARRYVKLMDCNSDHAMREVLDYWYQKYLAKGCTKEIKRIQRDKYEKMKKVEREKGVVNITTRGPIIYGTKNCGLFCRSSIWRVKRFYDYKLWLASMFAPTILIDCSFENDMTPEDTSVLAKSILAMLCINRDHSFPAHLLFCSLEPESMLMKKLKLFQSNITNSDYPFFYTTNNYLDLYPKETLVYLTPDSEQCLETFNINDVYIVGAFVDTLTDKPLSFAKAKRDELRTAKFPIEEEVTLSQGGKQTLKLAKVVNILNDLRRTNNWNFAKRHARNRVVISPKRIDHSSPMGETIHKEFSRSDIYEQFMNSMQ